MINEEKTLCFTGHRRINKGKLKNLPIEIEKSILLGYDTFLSGGAIGFDQYAASHVLRLKRKYPHIRLIFVLPCDKLIMSRKWSAFDKNSFLFLLNKSDDIIYISSDYYDGCMKHRNEKLVELSSYCIAYLQNERSGTGQTVRLMQKKEGIIVFL